MQLQTVKRTKQKLRLSLQGDTYTGKTMSALLLAYGLTNDWRKVAVIDTEQYSASLYSHLGPFQVLSLGAPFTVEKYTDAITRSEEAGMEVIILDSISTEWVGEGGILDEMGAVKGDYSQKWNAVMPLHHTFLSYILESSCHVIATVRRTSKRLMQEDGYAHYFTTVLSLNYQNEASVNKDRTGLLKSRCPLVLSKEVGRELLQWCEEGEEAIPREVKSAINRCTSLGELAGLMLSTDLQDERVVNAFLKRKRELERRADNTLPREDENNPFGLAA